MKNSLKIIGLSVLIIGLLAGLALTKNDQNINEGAAGSTSLSLTPTSQDVALTGSFATQIEMDSGTNKVTGIDIKLTYDPSKINIKEVKPTTDIANFQTVIKNEIDNVNGTLRYAAFTFDKNLSVSGKLNVLTIYGKPSPNSILGSYEIQFSPETIIVATGEDQNVLVSSNPTTIKVIESEPNSCGGTCGSNNNCKSNLHCYQGYCRNPLCSDSSNCDCTISPTPTTAPTIKAIQKLVTPKPIKTKTPTISPVPTQVKIDDLSRFNTTPIPVIIQTDETVSPLPRDEDTTKNSNKYGFLISDYTTLIFSSLGIISIIIAFFIIRKAINSKRPHILPPTNV